MKNTTVFIDRLRDKLTVFLDSFEDLQGLSSQYTYGNFGSTLTDADVHPADMAVNEDITLQNVLDAVATLAALKTAMDNGHGSKLYKLRR